MSTKKFSELPNLTNLTAGDIFAVVDDEGQLVSKKVTAEKISDFVFSSSVVGEATNTNSIINAINSKGNPSGDSQTFIANGLMASKVYFGNSYEDFNSVFQYSRIPDAPTAITRNDRLENYMEFAGVTQVNGNQKLVVRNIPVPAVEDEGQPITAQFTINADMIDSGSNNKFFNQASVDGAIETSFEGLFNKYSASFDGGNVKDAVIDIPGEFNIISNNDATAPKRARSFKVVDQDNLFTAPTGENPIVKSGDRIRVYGGDTGNISFDTPPALTVSKNDVQFPDPQASEPVVSFQYKVARFDLKTGAIGARSATQASPVGENTISFTSPGAVDVQDVLNSFNEDKFISLNIATNDANQGVLVYRKDATISSNPFKLIAVLGPKDISTPYKDYYMFDYTSWSGKSSIDNSYIAETLTHFPATISGLVTAEEDAKNLRGWADVTVQDVLNADGGGFDIIFDETETLYVNVDGICSFAHNNTLDIQDAINQKIDIGSNSLALNAKTYNVSNISVPSNFALTGVTGLTTLKKLPWSGFRNLVGSNKDASVLRTVSNLSPSVVTLSGIIVDGSHTNQYLLDDAQGTDEDTNVLVRLGIGSVDVTLENCKFTNMIGGGIYASSPTNLKMSNCEVTNGGITDRYETFAPLTADGGQNTMITNNVFRNFTAPIDCTVTRDGSIVANNVIKNCASGLDIFGSTFFISSPNVLVGPANESLQSPDVLNSDYDSVNILRSQIRSETDGPGGIFLSDPFIYQENGNVFDLTQDSVASSGDIVYRTKLIRGYFQNNTGDGTIIEIQSEEEYGNKIGPEQLDANAQTTVSYTNTSSPADKFATQSSYLTPGEKYEIGEVGNTDWTKVGAPINKVGVTFTYNSAGNQKLVQKNNTSADRNSINETVSTTGYVTRKQFEGYTNDGGTKLSDIVLTDHTGNANITRENGGFQFKVVNSDAVRGTHNTLSNLIDADGAYTRGALATLFNSKKKASISDSTAGKIHPHNSYHVGVAWTANYRHNVKVADIASYGSWGTVGSYNASGLDAAGATAKNVYLTGDADPMNAYRYYVDFTCQVNNLNHIDDDGNYYVSIDGHTISFGNNIFSEYGLVTDIDRNTTPNTVTVRFFGTKYNDDNSVGDGDAPNPSVATTGAFGTINMVDDFVLAKGIIK
jgi:hypothetical protein